MGGYSKAMSQEAPQRNTACALARVAELQLGNFNVQNLVNTAWAFATASSSDAQVFAALARAAELRLSHFNVRALANTTWALTDSAACTLGS